MNPALYYSADSTDAKDLVQTVLKSPGSPTKQLATMIKECKVVVDTNRLQCFNITAKEKLKALNIPDNYKSVYLQIIEAFDKDFRLPDKPGVVSTSGKRDRYNDAMMAGNIYMRLMTILLDDNPSDEQRLEVIDNLASTYDGYMKSQQKKGLKDIVTGIADIYKVITTGKTPQSDSSIKYEIPVDPNKTYAQQIGEEESGITIGDVFNAILGTGHITDYIQDNIL